MELNELQEHLLVQTPANEVLKVSNIYPPTESGTGYVTATLVYPIPGRTTVRSYLPDQVARWREPTDAIIAKYEIAWGYR
jgi:hypothetical protein